MQMVQDGDGQRRALRGVRACTQLVEKTEGIRVRILQDGNDAGHMGGEGAQALLDALLIPDIRIDLPENGKLRTVLGGNMKPRLPHQTEQSGGFQGNRLSARIGAGDDEQVVVPAQPDIDGNGLLFVQKGVSCPTDIDDMILVENGLGCILFQGQRGFCKNEIQTGHHVLVFCDFHRMLPGESAEGGENLFDFFLFLKLQLTHLIIQIDHGGGLNENGAPRGGLIVDHARHLAAVFRLDGQTVTPISGGDQGVLQIGMQRTVHHAVQLGMNPFRGHGHAAPHMFQPRTGIVADFFLGKDAPVNLLRELRQRLQRGKQRRQGIVRNILPVFSSVIFHPCGVLQQGSDVQKLRDGEGASDFQGF